MDFDFIGDTIRETLIDIEQHRALAFYEQANAVMGTVVDGQHLANLQIAQAATILIGLGKSSQAAVNALRIAQRPAPVRRSSAILDDGLDDGSEYACARCHDGISANVFDFNHFKSLRQCSGTTTKAQAKSEIPDKPSGGAA